MTALPTVLVIAIVLTMFHGLLAVHDRANSALQNLQKKFSITVYLKDDADPFEVGNLITALEQRPDVIKPVSYTSKEEAWKTMSETFSLDTNLLQKYKFSLPASLTITPRKLDDAALIQAFLETNGKNLISNPLVAQNKQADITNQMMQFVQNVRNATLRNIVLFILLFVIGGALLLSSAIHLAITSRHTEINIMKLVGASYGAITTPFVIEGLILSVLSFILHLIFLAVLPLGFGIGAYPNALLLEFAAIILLSSVVSWLTTMIYIKKKTIV